MRNGASVSHERAESRVPRAARITLLRAVF